MHKGNQKVKISFYLLRFCSRYEREKPNITQSQLFILEHLLK